MSESKKKLYKRKTVKKYYDALKKRLLKINDLGLILNIRDVIIFGSFVNTNNDYVHDLDVCVVYDNPSEVLSFDEKRMLYQKNSKRLFPKHRLKSFVDILSYPEYELERVLKGGSGIYSIHGVIDEKIAQKRDHIYIFKNGESVKDEKISKGFLI